MKKLVILLLLVCILSTGCVFFPAEEEFLQPPLVQGDSLVYDTATVEKRTVTKINNVSVAFDYKEMYSVAFAARPTKTTRTPDASGSRVPVCPTRRVL